MKKVTLVMFGVSVFAGLGYLTFANTPIGKNTLINWLLKKWKAETEFKRIQAESNSKKIKVDFDFIKKELKKLPYRNLELLAHYTWLLPPKIDFEDGSNIEPKKAERLKKLLTKITRSDILKIADLSQLKYIVLPNYKS